MTAARLELADAGLTVAAKDYRRAERRTLEAFEAVVTAWVQEGDLPPALLTPTGMAVHVLYDVFERFGVRCPDDVSVVCFDSNVLGSLTRPKPTGLVTHPYTIGQVALHEMARVLREPSAAKSEVPRKTVLPMQLVEGGSVRACEGAPVQARA
jgi:LacI family transcriptional regulator